MKSIIEVRIDLSDIDFILFERTTALSELLSRKRTRKFRLVWQSSRTKSFLKCKTIDLDLANTLMGKKGCLENKVLPPMFWPAPNSVRVSMFPFSSIFFIIVLPLIIIKKIDENGNILTLTEF